MTREELLDWQNTVLPARASVLVWERSRQLGRQVRWHKPARSAPREESVDLDAIRRSVPWWIEMRKADIDPALFERRRSTPGAIHNPGLATALLRVAPLPARSGIGCFGAGLLP